MVKPGFGFGYFNEDRILDVVIANDQVRNFFLQSRTLGGFDEQGIEDGFAYDRRGECQPWASISIATQTNEIREVVGNFFMEMTSLHKHRWERIFCR